MLNFFPLLILQLHLCLSCFVHLTGTDFTHFSSILVANGISQKIKDWTVFPIWDDWKVFIILICTINWWNLIILFSYPQGKCSARVVLLSIKRPYLYTPTKTGCTVYFKTLRCSSTHYEYKIHFFTRRTMGSFHAKPTKKF